MRLPCRVEMAARRRFRGVVEESDEGGGGRWIVVPFDGKEAFGAARSPVRGSINGTPFRSRLAVYGGVTYLGLNKELRTAAGIDVGSNISVEMELDDAPRDVEVPDALARALQRDDGARAAFDELSFTHRKEYATWIAGAKREDTRQRRAAKAVDMLRDGVTHP